MNFLETALFYLAIGMAIFLPISLLKVAFKERYAQILIKRQKQGVDNLLKQTPPMIRYILILTWGLLFSLALVPLALAYYLEVNFFITFTCLALMFATMLVEYHYQKWLYQHLKKLES